VDAFAGFQPFAIGFDPRQFAFDDHRGDQAIGGRELVAGILVVQRGQGFIRTGGVEAALDRGEGRSSDEPVHAKRVDPRGISQVALPDIAAIG
jgi:hypothetical protein